MGRVSSTGKRMRKKKISREKLAAKEIDRQECADERE